MLMATGLNPGLKGVFIVGRTNVVHGPGKAGPSKFQVHR